MPRETPPPGSARAEPRATAAARSRPGLRSLAYWDALSERYPLGSRWELVRPAASVVVANLLTARALARGELRPWELVVLVALEALAFSAIAWAQTLAVPADARPDASAEPGAPRQTLLQRLGTLAFGLTWLGCVYGLIFGFYLRETPPFADAARDPLGFLARSAIRWPLAVSVGGALLDAAADWRFWKRRGGVLLSTPGFTAIARWLTLLLGGIPFFVPFAAGAGVIAGVSKLIERRLSRNGAGRPRSHSLWPVLPFPVLGLLLFAGMGWLIQAGAMGWTIGYVSAKAASELLILGLPLMALRAAREERTALAGGAAVGESPPGGAKRRLPR